MKELWKSFKEGFVGAFVLAGSIVMAIISVASDFSHGHDELHHGRSGGSTQM